MMGNLFQCPQMETDEEREAIDAMCNEKSTRFYGHDFYEKPELSLVNLYPECFYAKKLLTSRDREDMFKNKHFLKAWKFATGKPGQISNF